MSPRRLVLHHDHVQLLEREQQRQGGHRARGPGEQVAQPAAPDRRMVGVRQVRRSTTPSTSATATSDSGVPRKAPVTSSPAPTSASAKSRRAMASPIDAERHRPVAARSPGARRARPTGSPRACRSRARRRRPSPRPRDHAPRSRRAAGSRARPPRASPGRAARASGPTPAPAASLRARRGRDTSRATAICSAEPGTIRMMNADTSAASEP